MNKKIKISSKRINFLFFLLTFIFAVTILAAVLFFFGNYRVMLRSPYVEQLSKALYSNFDIVIKNRLTKDKKYIWLKVNIKWKLEEFSRPRIYRTKKDVKIYMNNIYLKGAGEYAVGMAIIGKEALDIFNDREIIEKSIKEKIEEKLIKKTKYKENVEIINTKITKLRILTKPYEGEGWPERSKQAKRADIASVIHTLEDGTKITIGYPNK